MGQSRHSDLLVKSDYMRQLVKETIECIKQLQGVVNECHSSEGNDNSEALDTMKRACKGMQNFSVAFCDAYQTHVAHVNDGLLDDASESDK